MSGTRATIAPDSIGRAERLVDENELASALAVDGDEAFPAVYATSRMVALMERAAARLMQPLLGAGELSVGVQLDVRHMVPTPPGATVRAEARFVGMEGKLYRFEVVAFDGAGEIGRGQHSRAIVEAARLVAGAARRARNGS
jgi:fluoroacetyl-CoA thioesterase